MGTKAKKKRAMRSRQSGVKKMQLVKSNHTILRKLGFIGIFIAFLLIGCVPVRIVDVSSRHNYYERHRYNSYTAPIWIPGHGIVLQTYRIKRYNPYTYPKRGRH